MTDYEASVSDSLDIVGHFPGSLLPSASNLLKGTDRTARWSQRNVWKSISSQLISNEVFETERVGAEEGKNVRWVKALWQILCRFLMAVRVIQHSGSVINKLESKALRHFASSASSKKWHPDFSHYFTSDGDGEGTPWWAAGVGLLTQTSSCFSVEMKSYPNNFPKESKRWR